jgi:hypothetical protein
MTLADSSVNVQAESVETGEQRDQSQFSGQFVQLPRKIIALLPKMSRTEMLALFRVIEEHLSKGGTETDLIVTQKDFVAFGCRRNSIAPAIVSLSRIEVCGVPLLTVAPDKDHKGNLKPVNVFQLPWLPKRGNVVRLVRKTEQGVVPKTGQNLDPKTVQEPCPENGTSFLELDSLKESTQQPAPALPKGWEEFRQAYPKRANINEALGAYVALIASGVKPSRLIDAAGAYALTFNADFPAYKAKQAKAWLEADIWRDYQGANNWDSF